jgi:hypothetical protein
LPRAISPRKAPSRCCHKLLGQRSIWRQVEIAGVPDGMLAIDQ